MEEAFWSNEMLVEKKHVHFFWNAINIMTGPLWWMDPKGWEGPGVCYSRDSRVVMDYRSSPIAGTTLPLCRHMARHGVASPMSGLHMSEASVSARRPRCKLHGYCLVFCGTQQSQSIYMNLICRNYCSKYMTIFVVHCGHQKAPFYEPLHGVCRIYLLLIMIIRPKLTIQMAWQMISNLLARFGP